MSSSTYVPLETRAQQVAAAYRERLESTPRHFWWWLARRVPVHHLIAYRRQPIEFVRLLHGEAWQAHVTRLTRRFQKTWYERRLISPAHSKELAEHQRQLQAELAAAQQRYQESLRQLALARQLERQSLMQLFVQYGQDSPLYRAASPALRAQIDEAIAHHSR